MTAGTEFSNMALNNDFNVDRMHVKSRPINEYIPVCSIGELHIYRHKSETRLYGTTFKNGVFAKTFTTGDTEKMRYRRLYMHHWDMYIENKIDFEDVLAEKLFLKYWDM